MQPSIKIITAKSKKGNDYTCLQVKIGEYEARLFPSKCECAYIKSLIQENAHKDFQEAVKEDK